MFNASHASRTAPREILVVDADADAGRELVECLQGAGFNARLAVSAQTALAEAQRLRPDIVMVTDDLASADEASLTRTLRRPDLQWGLLLVTTRPGQASGLKEIMAAGADDFVYLPIDTSILVAKLTWMIQALSSQRSLSEARRQNELISEHIIDGLIIIDESGIMRACNSKAQQIFGYSRADMLGKNVNFLMPEPYHSAHDGYLAHYLHGGPARIIGVGERHVSGLRKNGEVFPLELGVTSISLEGERAFMGIVRDISARVYAEEKLKENAERLQRYHDAQEEENALGRNIMMRQMRIGDIEDPGVRVWLNPASDFSGDMLSATLSADGRLYGILADATGHGLAAAITGLPLMPMFHRMAREGMPLSHMVSEINNELCQTIPTGRFVAIAIVVLDRNAGEAELWLGGMPEALLLDGGGQLCGRFQLRNLPLGILPMQASEVTPISIKLPPGGQLALYSDGIVEACDPAQEIYGQTRLEEALASAAPAERIAAVQESFACFMDGHGAQDDISLLLLDCDPPA